MTVPARWPFAHVTIELKQHPALVIEWRKTLDANGYPVWYARCIWWDDNTIHDEMIPSAWVSKAGG